MVNECLVARRHAAEETGGLMVADTVPDIPFGTPRTEFIPSVNVGLGFQ